MLRRLFKNNKFSRTKESGFTLVEMLIVVTIVGILSGIVLSVLNQQAQKARAEDAVNRSKMEQVAQALESFKAATGTLPTESNNVPVDANLKEFVVSWPEPFKYKVSSNKQDFAVYVQQSNKSYLKYSSVWADFKVCKSNTANIGEISSCDEI